MIGIFEIIRMIVGHEIVVNIMLIVEEGLDGVEWESIVVHFESSGGLTIVRSVIVTVLFVLIETFPGEGVEEERVFLEGVDVGGVVGRSRVIVEEKVRRIVETVSFG